ncbi:hypothetical protein [Salinibacter ruber]|uniref:Uncharacterized protein n=1 Tax=Salinibacter ruber (strain DSM 13855 / M31) TaxID=309807 RepID=Q2S3K9_SALRD|nr:hypothetical protein [Salinibacter ruber]ABC43993.1 hypothetical protein SRU_1093 [Salinibacter ruber DSM 13855]MCS4101489.1 hypothetical protein [Salinibacter ruber]
MPDPNDSEPEGYAYFLDYDKDTGAANVFAAVTNRGLFGDNTERYTGAPDEVFLDDRPVGTAELEGFGAVFSRDNSGICWTGADLNCLGPRTPEAVARQIHPRLFERIELGR